MNTNIYELNAGGRAVRYLLQYPGSERYFTEPLRPCPGGEYDLALTPGQMEFGRALFPPDTPDDWLEYKLLLTDTAAFLLRSAACIIHGVAFSWRDRAWLLCAPSGTGKTTQFAHWKRLCGADVRLVSGDQPIVTLEADGEVLVWASPWTGKERWTGVSGPVPLGGIIFLEQAEENELISAPLDDRAQRLLAAFMCRPDAVEEIRTLAALADAMLSRHPVWLLRNRGDPASALLTRNAIEAYLSEGRQDHETL